MKLRCDWTKGSPTLVSSRLKKAGTGERKCRLYCVACCARVRRHIDNPDCLRLLELTEQWADDPDRAAETASLRRAVHRWSHKIHPGARSDVDWFWRWSVWCAAAVKIVPPAQGFLKQGMFRPFLRDIFGDDLEPCAFDAGWRSVNVIDVARRMYATKDFSAMPVLADALEDAGCIDEAVLEHCRESCEHVRGCWVVDAVLGYS
jgi:hypothetical protein